MAITARVGMYTTIVSNNSVLSVSSANQPEQRCCCCRFGADDATTASWGATRHFLCHFDGITFWPNEESLSALALVVS